MSILPIPEVEKETKEHYLDFDLGIKKQLKDKINCKSKKLFQHSENFWPTSSPVKRLFSLSDCPSSANILMKAGADGITMTGHSTSLKRKERTWDDESSHLISATMREVHVMPPTPRKKKFRAEPAFSRDVRPNPLLPVVQSFGAILDLEIIDAALNPIQHLQSLISRHLKGDLYKLPSGQIVPVIQQPIPEKPTCGPGCVLMLALSNIEKLMRSDDFWIWYGGARLANSESLLTAFSFLSIKAKICRLVSSSIDLSSDQNESSIDLKRLDPKDAVAAVKEAIRITGNPVILAITHPILKGHWIIVDGFHNGCALLRDPYTGMAFALPEKTLSRWLLEKDPVQDMIYFPADSTT